MISDKFCACCYASTTDPGLPNVMIELLAFIAVELLRVKNSGVCYVPAVPAAPPSSEPATLACYLNFEVNCPGR